METQDNMEEGMEALLKRYEDFILMTQAIDADAKKFKSGKLTNVGFVRFRNNLNDARKIAFELRQLSMPVKDALKESRAKEKEAEL